MLSYLHGDHLGSASLATDVSGSVVSQMRYYPYGETRSGTAPTDYQFTGQRFEAGLGLYDYHARYYHPALGRFISADTIVPNPGDPQSLNRYAYVRNNPLKYTDPTGHMLDYGKDAAGGGIPRLPPWYAPVIRGAEKAWGWADANIGEFGRYIEADRLVHPVQYSRSGTLLSSEGLSVHYEDPFVTFDTNVRLKGRVEGGDSSKPRVDQDKLTIRLGELSQIYTNWEGSECGMVSKFPAHVVDLGRGQAIGTRWKGMVGVGMAPPLNPYMVAESTGEVAYSGVLDGEALTVKVAPALTANITFHGGPVGLVFAPVAVYYGGIYIVPALTGGVAAPLVPQFAR